MEWSEIRQRIDDGEDDETELGRFRSWSENDWLRTVCAFANSRGGLVVLGVLDDGTLDGVPMPAEEVRERLSNSLHNGLNRPVSAHLRHHDIDGVVVHWIEVLRCRGPEPLKYRGRVYIRRGRRTDEPDASEIQELYNQFGIVVTEERIVPGTSVADIEVIVFREYMARKGIDLDNVPVLPIETDLRNREALDRDADGSLRATLFGILCFGRSPQDHAPTRRFFVDLVAYAGTSRADDVLLSGQATGRLDEQVRRTEDWFRVLGRTETYSGMERTDMGIVPARALREAVVNAVVHRDYSILGASVLVEVFDDRVVITSPGALPNHKRRESVIAGGLPRSRNEGMATVLLDLGLMERRGSGFPRIIRAMADFNGTQPDLETDREERWVRVTLWRTAPHKLSR